MFPAIILAVVLSTSPTPQPPPRAVTDEYTSPTGHRVRWASVTYSLPDDQIAEVLLIVDDTTSGDGYLFVDGEVIVHSSYDSNGVVNWTSSDPRTSELAATVLAGLSGGAAYELLNALIDGPRAFPCSEWGEKF